MAENLTGTITNFSHYSEQDEEAPPPPPPPARRSKRWVLLGLFGALAVAAVGVYVWQAQVAADPNAPVTLTYWGMNESAAVMQPLIDGYKKLHPNVTIHYEERDPDNHFATVKSRLALHGSDVPDIVRVHSSWVPVLRNELAPLPASVMTADDYAKTFYPVTKEDLLWQGQYYGIPLEVDGLALVYNLDMFRKAGISAPPVTWDQLRQDAQVLTTRDDQKKVLTAGVAMGETANVDDYADIAGLLMSQNMMAEGRLQFTDSTGKAVFDQAVTPDGRNLTVEALSFYRLFSTTDDDWDTGMDPSSVAFSKGEVAMILTTSEQLASIVSQNPQLQFGVAPVPQLVAGGQVGYASYWVETVAKNSPHQLQAWQFLKYLSDKDQEVALAQQEEKQRPFAEPYSRVDLASSVSQDPVLGPYVSQGPTYQTSFFTNQAQAPEYTGALDASLATALGSLGGGNTGATSDGLQAVKDLAKAVNQTLAAQ